MKLYATTTSERASKGQGGNKFLTIEMTVDTGTHEKIGQVIMKESSLSQIQIIFQPCPRNLSGSDDVVLRTINIKGKKEKGENECGHKQCAKEICIDDIPF